MMIDVLLKSDHSRSRRYGPEEIQSLASGGNRWRVAMRSHVWRPPTDVYETEKVVVVRVEIAGMREEDFSISLSGHFLVVRGQRPDVHERRAFHQMEIVFGDFMSEVELSCEVVAEEVKAEYRMGFLRLELPKAQPKKIRIED